MPPSLSSTRAARRHIGALVLAPTALLAACISPPPAGTPPAPVAVVVPAPLPVAPPPAEPPRETAPQASAPAPESAQLTQALAYADRVQRMPPAELTREIARLGEAEDTLAASPLHLALALAQTRQPVDTARALAQVQRLLGHNDTATQPLQPLARLLEARLLQQRRLEEQLERQAQQLRDAQRRNDQLNERLEAVRAIERSMTARPPAPAASEVR
ncbi:MULTISPECIES: hypothetical protein [unclassified Acidovorax]|uniref:hypothetical protein n=1 Tax=unclassified Acidovorax TaxID=2684926 RepID=UPI000710BB6F|nr:MULTISPECIES: hypothetical protein [unclassified Acidovorax]KRC19464.1 hypothetical protein ASE28_29820 [Acidovorax sp. Root219]KRC23341.1 hypothetical protein ASE31_01635 [Acidovorax sp. Root217]